jgi:hypothetical protein
MGRIGGSLMVAQVRDIDRKAVMISRRLTALSKKERKLIDRIKRLEKYLKALRSGPSITN